jgi:hypothetical protein
MPFCSKISDISICASVKGLGRFVYKKLKIKMDRIILDKIGPPTNL